MTKPKSVDPVEVFSTKLRKSTKRTLANVQRVQQLRHGDGYSMRNLVEEMLVLYMATNPNVQKAVQDLEAMQQQILGTVSGTVEDPEPVANLEPVEKMVATVRYIGKDGIHLYDPERKNSTGCSLAGEIDPTTIQELPASEVTCKKCRYCRKEVFA